MKEPTRKLAAIVFTDIVGFTELMGRNENRAMALLEQQRSLLRPIVDNFNGEWLKEIGDGILMSFPSAVKAVTCALEIQRILAHNPDLTLRIGIHIGDVIKKDGDVFGDGVNIASRLEPLAEPGGICVSERVHEDIRNKPDISAAFQEEQLLKGVDKPIKVYSIFTQMDTPPAPEVPETARPVSRGSGSRLPYLIGGVVLGLLVTVFALRRSGPSVSEARDGSLAIFNFDNLSAQDQTDRTGQILQELIITDLSGIDDLKVFSSQRLFDIQKQMGTKETRFIEPSMALDIAREAGASSMMTGNIIKVGETIVLTSRLLDVVDGSVIMSRKVEGQDIYAMVDQLADLVIEDLSLGIIETVDMAVSEKTSSSMTAYNHYVAGVDHLNSLRFNDAVVELQKAVGMDPMFKRALYKLAVSQWWAKGAEIASSDSATIVTLDTYLALEGLSNEEIRLAEGVKNVVSKKFSNALATFEYLTELYPDNKEYWYLLGECHFHGPLNESKAIFAFEKAIQLDPDFELASYHMIAIYTGQRLFEKSLALIEKKLEKNPGSSELLHEMGLLRYRMDDTEAALEISMRNISKDPANIRAQFGRVLSLRSLGRFKEAEAHAERLVREHPANFDVRMLYDGIFILQGRISALRSRILDGFDEIVGHFDDVYPDNPLWAEQTVGKILLVIDLRSGDLSSIQQDLTAFKDLRSKWHGSNIDHLFVVAASFDEIGDTNSFSMYERMINDIIIENELSGSMSNYTVGLNLLSAFREGRWKKVLRHYREFSGSNLGDIFRDYAIAKKCEALYGLKEYDLALVTAKRMVSNDQIFFHQPFNRPLGYYWQGRVHEDRGNTAAALSAYGSLMELWKDGDRGLPIRIDTEKRLRLLKNTS